MITLKTYKQGLMFGSLEVTLKDPIVSEIPRTNIPMQAWINDAIMSLCMGTVDDVALATAPLQGRRVYTPFLNMLHVWYKSRWEHVWYKIIQNDTRMSLMNTTSWWDSQSLCRWDSYHLSSGVLKMHTKWKMFWLWCSLRAVRRYSWRWRN